MVEAGAAPELRIHSVSPLTQSRSGRSNLVRAHGEISECAGAQKEQSSAVLTKAAALDKASGWDSQQNIPY